MRRTCRMLEGGGRTVETIGNGRYLCRIALNEELGSAWTTLRFTTTSSRFSKARLEHRHSTAHHLRLFWFRFLYATSCGGGDSEQRLVWVWMSKSKASRYCKRSKQAGILFNILGCQRNVQAVFARVTRDDTLLCGPSTMHPIVVLACLPACLIACLLACLLVGPMETCRAAFASAVDHGVGTRHLEAYRRRESGCREGEGQARASSVEVVHVSVDKGRARAACVALRE